MSFRANVGIGFEGVNAYGTPVVRTAFARCLEASVDAKHGGQVPKTTRLASAEDVVLGEYDVNVALRGELRPETVGAFLRAHAGNASVTTTQPDSVGHPTVRQHVIDHKDTRAPITWERRLGTLAKSEVVQGVVLEEFGVEWQKDLVTFNVKGPGQKDVLSSTPTTPTFDARAPFARHQTVVQLAGSTIGTQAGRVKLARQVVKDDYETGGRYRVDAEVGEVMATLEFDMMFRDSALLERSFGAVGGVTPQDSPLYQSANVAITGPVISGTYNQKLDLNFPRVWLDRVSPAVRGKEGMTQRVKLTALYDEATAYLWRGTLTNTQASI